MTATHTFDAAAMFAAAMFAAADANELDAYIVFMADDVRYQFGNAEEIHQRLTLGRHAPAHPTADLDPLASTAALMSVACRGAWQGGWSCFAGESWSCPAVPAGTARAPTPQPRRPSTRVAVPVAVLTQEEGRLYRTTRL